MYDFTMNDSNLLWKSLESEIIYESRIFKLRMVKSRSPKGKISPFVRLTRLIG